MNPVREWSFRADGTASPSKPGEQWNDAAMEIGLATAKGVLHQRWELPQAQTWSAPDWHEVSLALDPGVVRAGGRRERR